MKEVLKNKKLLIIIVAALVLIIGAVLAVIIINGKDEKENNNDNTPEVKEENKVEEEKAPEQAPAANTEELKTQVTEVEVKEITKDKIVFSEKAEVKVGEKVAVWVYSEPKFLGYFKVKEVNGERIIEGLEEKLAELDIEAGNHNIAITTTKGETVGYVDIVIEETGTLKEEVKPVIKEVKETEEIKFKTETKKNANLEKGQSKTIQEGVAGEKEITYEVTYDGKTGEEISRKKVSEKITKEAVNKIVETGNADFNLNTAKVQGSTMGFMCTEKDPVYGGCIDAEGTPEFNAIGINGTYYAKCASHSTACKSLGIKSSIKLAKSKEGYTGKVNGKTYYFDPRAGDGGPAEPLTEQQCNDYNLVCGKW